MKKYNSKMQLRQWDEYDPELVKFFRRHHTDAVPWAAWGDFDGNSTTDVALQMRSAEGRLFKLVVYRQRRDGQWDPYLLAQGRSDLTVLASGKSISYLTLCPGGQNVGYWPEYDKARHVRTELDLPRMWLQHDGITNVAFGKAAVTYYWQNGKYRHIITAD